MKYTSSGLALALCVLMTAAFVAGCNPTERATPTGGGQATEQPTPTSGGQATEQPTPTSGGQGTEQPTPTSGGQATEQPTPTSGGQATEQPTPTSGGQATEQPTPTSGGATRPPTATARAEAEGATPEPTRRRQASGGDDDLEDVLRLLAMGSIWSFNYVDIAAMSTDPDLEPLLQRLVDIWDAQSVGRETSDFEFTLRDADFAVSWSSQGDYSKSGGILLGGMGMEDVDLGFANFMRMETGGVTYWLDRSGSAIANIAFLPNEMVLLTYKKQVLDAFLERTGHLINDESNWSEEVWERYLDGVRGEVVSMDDMISDMRDSLVFDLRTTIKKASPQEVELVTSLIPPEGVTDQEIAEVEDEAVANYRSEGGLEECSDTDFDYLSGIRITLTTVCPVQSVGPARVIYNLFVYR